MEYEQAASSENGITWTSRMYCPPGTDSPIAVPEGSADWVAFKKGFFSWLNQEVRNHDVLLLRYSMYNPYQARFVRDCPIPVISMHHTLEVPEMLGNGNLRSRLRAAGERFLGPRTLKHVSAIAAVTQQIADYEKARSGQSDVPLILYGNGAVYGESPVVEARLPESGEHEFMLMSSQFGSWMGLDLLFEAAQRTSQRFKVHIVGRLTDEQAELLKADDRFIAHGLLDHAQMESLMAVCTLGLSTFAIHRKKFTEGNTLKVREYLRAGLPTFGAYREDVFDDSFPYYKNGDTDFDQILAYADAMRDVDRHTVSEVSRPLIEKSRVVQKMYDEIQRLFF